MTDNQVKLARPTTGIPKIDAEVKEIMKLKPRDIKPIYTMDHFCPPTPRDVPSEFRTVYVVGAGWNFPSAATALVAAGFKIVAYEMTPEKIAKGQLGSTLKDAYFSLGQVERAILVQKIAEQAVTQSIQESKGTWEEKIKEYDSLDNWQKVSKREVIEMKEAVLELLKEDKKLEIRHQEVTIDMVQSWLEENKPVFMISGLQVDLEKVGLDGIYGKPGFVKEFLLDTDDTESLIKMICAKQQAFMENRRQHVPKVAIVGGGPSSVACTKDLLERVHPNCLEIFWIKPVREKIAPRQPVLETQKSEKEKWIPGHVAKVNFSLDGKIKSVKVVDSRDGEEQDIPCGLLVHTWNQFTDQRKEDFYRKACEDITNVLDEAKPSNGLVRDLGIGPADNERDIMSRVTVDWIASIEDDDILKDEIRRLLQRKGRSDYTIVVTGKNAMTKAVMALAESLGYDGHWYQVQAFQPNHTVEQLTADIVETKKCIWHDVEGQVIKEGTTFHKEQFSLTVRKTKDGTAQSVSGLDGVINCAGKSYNTSLVKAMKARGYIGEFESFPFLKLYSNYELLFGHNALFGRRPMQLPPLEEELPKEELPQENDNRKESLYVVYPAQLFPATGAAIHSTWEEDFWAAFQVLLNIEILLKQEKIHA